DLAATRPRRIAHLTPTGVAKATARLKRTTSTPKECPALGFPCAASVTDTASPSRQKKNSSRDSPPATHVPIRTARAQPVRPARGLAIHACPFHRHMPSADSELTQRVPSQNCFPSGETRPESPSPIR